MLNLKKKKNMPSNFAADVVMLHLITCELKS